MHAAENLRLNCCSDCTCGLDMRSFSSCEIYREMRVIYIIEHSVILIPELSLETLLPQTLRTYHQSQE